VPPDGSVKVEAVYFSRLGLAAKLRLKPPRNCAADEAPLRCQQCLFGPLRGPRHLL